MVLGMAAAGAASGVEWKGDANHSELAAGAYRTGIAVVAAASGLDVSA